MLSWPALSMSDFSKTSSGHEKWSTVAVQGAVQGAVHMVTARFGCERAMVGTRWNTSHLDCMNIIMVHHL